MLLFLLCSAQFVIVLDVTIVAVALPAIQDDLGFSDGGLEWVVTVYTLAFGGLLVSAGRAADLFGRRRLFALGLALFARRVLPAGRGEAAEPGGEATRRGGEAAGPGGEATRRGGEAARRRRAVDRAADAAARLDLPGAALVTAGLVLLVLGLTEAQDGRAAWPLLAGPVLLGLFFAAERRVPSPVLGPGTFANREFTRALLVALALTASTTPAMLFSILHQQQELGRSATEAGLACLPFNAAVVAGSMLAGRIRLAHTATMAAGLVGVTAGVLLIGAVLIAGYAVMGLGLGAASVASTAAGTRHGRPGVASGLLTAAAQIGPALGLAIATGLTAAAGIAAAVLAPLLIQRRASSSRVVAASPPSVTRTPSGTPQADPGAT